jgi:hypothetical protein
MKNLKAFLGIAALVAIGFSMSACGAIEELTDRVSSVSLSSTSLQMTVGQERTLTATVRPSSARNKEVYWESSRPSVATVSNSGRVNAVGTGTAVITVTTEDGGYTADCSVTVTGGGDHTSHDWGPWQTSATQHWRICSIGGEEGSRANHSGNPCSVCGYSSGGGGSQTFNTIAEFRTWLTSASANSASNPYYVTMNISDFGGGYYAAGNLGNVLRSSVGTNKYVNINLSGTSLQSIPNEGFRNCSTLVGVTIGGGITSIGNQVFSGCANLTSVTIGSSVQSIGNSAFYNCNNLPSITIGSGVTSIGNEAFRNCNGLTSVTMSGSVTSIGDNAFRGCITLNSLTIGSNVTSIGQYAFEGCTNLRDVTIPSRVINIGNNAFQACTNLNSVTITNGVGGIGNYTFQNCTNLSSITIPSSVNGIGNNAFQNCGLVSAIIGSGVASIGGSAFNNCNSLMTVTFQGTIPANGINSYQPFPGDLRTKYYAVGGGAGTYTRAGTVWTKQ